MLQKSLAESRPFPPVSPPYRLIALLIRLDDEVIDDAVRFVDMLQGAMTQPVSELIVFFL